MQNIAQCSCLASPSACSQRLVGCRCVYSAEGALYETLAAPYTLPLLAPSAGVLFHHLGLLVTPQSYLAARWLSLMVPTLHV